MRYIITGVIVLLCALPGTLAAQAAEARLAEMEAHLKQVRGQARLHTGVWMGFYGVSIIGNGVGAGLATTPDPEYSAGELALLRQAEIADVYRDVLEGDGENETDEYYLYLAARDSHAVEVTNLSQAVALDQGGVLRYYMSQIMRDNFKAATRIRQAKERRIVSATSSALGLASMLVRPHPALAESPLETMPAGTPAATRLAAMNQWYASGAAASAQATGLRQHIAGGVVAVLAGAAVTGGYKQPYYFGWSQFALTLLSSELRIWTYPRGLETYASQQGLALGEEPRSEIHFAGVVPYENGLAAVFIF